MNQAILTGIHWFYISVINYIGLVLIIDQMMNRRRSLIPMWAICIIRVCITTGLVTYVYHYYGIDAVNQAKINVISSSVLTWIQTFIMFWVYENVGASFIAALAEMTSFGLLTVCNLPGALLSGTGITGMDQLWLKPFYIFDLLLPFIYFPVVYLIVNKGQLFFSRCRKLRFQNKPFWIAMTILLFFYVKLWDISQYFNYATRREFVIAIFVILPTMAVLWMVYESGVDLEHDFLLKQKKMQHIYYGALRSQIYSIQKDMEQSQRHIMGLLEAEEAHGGDIYLEEYIKRMKARSQVLSAGIYCQNQMVDSVLFSYSEQFEKQDVSFTVKVANVSMQGLSEDKLFELLITLLDLGLNNKKGEALTISVNRVKGRQVIELEGITTKPEALALRRIKEISTELHGFYDIEKDGHKVRMTVFLGRK